MSLRGFLVAFSTLLWLGSAVNGTLAQSSKPTFKAITPSQKPVVTADYGRLPLAFVRNDGQTDKKVDFLARSNNLTLFLTSNEAVFALAKPMDAPNIADAKHPSKPRAVVASVVRMRLRAANAHPAVCGLEVLPGKVNYFIGKDPTKWRHDVPTYARVRYSHVYRGVDLVYYGNNRQLEYDFVVAPHANPRQIALSFAGARNVRIERSGELSLALKDGQLRWHRPVVYQEVRGHRHPISGRFVSLGRGTVGFTVGMYEANLPLVIDPQLIYATYLGGTGGTRTTRDSDCGFRVAVDAQGNAYVTGAAVSSDFPVTKGAFQTTWKGNDINAFVTKLSTDGTSLIYSTYLGGSGYFGGFGSGIAVDAQGNAYVTGSTNASDFPVTRGAFQTKLNSTKYGNAFITKLNPTGSALIYSTYLGGSADDGGNGIAVDALGNAYVAGATLSSDFPVTKNAFQTKLKGSYPNAIAFITKLNATGSALIYSTYLGGSIGFFSQISDEADGIAIDAHGSAYVTGLTNASDFPVTKGAFQKQLKNKWGNTFVTKLSADGSSLVYSTYLGGSIDNNGSNNDWAFGIAVDAHGHAYVTGVAQTPDFPVTKGAFQAARKGKAGNAFITKLSADGSSLVYSTFLGGTGFPDYDRGRSIVVDALGNAYVVGETASPDFPVSQNAVQPKLKSLTGSAFITKLSADGSSLAYSTFLGGTGGKYGSEEGFGIALDQQSNVYITGISASPDFPVTKHAFQTTLKCLQGNGFIAKLQISKPTYFSDVPKVAATFGDKVLLSAQINDSATHVGIPNATIVFALNDADLGTAITDAYGKATLATTIPDGLTAGQTYPLQVRFDGDNVNSPDSDNGTLNLLPGKTKFVSVADVTGKPGAKVTFTVNLVRKSDGKGVGGETVVFKVEGSSVGAAQTDSTGTASLSYTIPKNARVGAHSTSVAFPGDSNYIRSTATGILTATK